MMQKVRKIMNGLKWLTYVRPKFSHRSLLRTVTMLVILVLAFSIRMLPIRWGYYLSEFDPYYQYRQAKYISENGLFGDNSWMTWHDFLSWYPWGNEISSRSYPGLPVTAAVLFTLLNTFGIPLVPYPTLDPLLSDPVYILCVIFPVIMGTITCLMIYFLGRDFGGEAVGLFAAFFLALDPSYIGRTSLGFFDDETVGIFSLLLFLFFFLRSIDDKRTLKVGLLYAIGAGLSLAYLSSSWGASRYPIVMTAIFALVLLILRRYTTRLLLSYAITFLLTFSVALSIPYLSINFLLLTEILPVWGVLFLLIMVEVYRRTDTQMKKIVYIGGLIMIVAAALLFLLWNGYIQRLGTKFLSVLNPFVRFDNPLIESVAEHRPSAWGTFYYNFGIGIFFLPVGLFFIALSATNPGILFIIYGLTSVFFASSMIRLVILMSPVVSLLWAFALVRILKPFTIFIRTPPQISKRKSRFKRTLGRETAAGIVLLIFILLNLTFVIGTDFITGPTAGGPRVYLQAYSPTTIAAAGMSIQPSDTARDWLNTLTWIRETLPPSPQNSGGSGTVVASWWDYGYWITTIANRSSLADNGTWNWSQIRQIGLMFMSNETQALKILEKYRATHIIVYTTFDTEGRLAMVGGDEGKWQWMARIPGLDDTKFGNYTLGWDWVDTNLNGSPDENDSFPQNSKGQNSTIYKLMNYGRETVLYGYSLIELSHFEEAYFSQKPGSGAGAAVPGTQYVALVCVYKINYPTE